MADLDKSSDTTQVLVRTGSLQGARYAWITDIDNTLRQNYSNVISATERQVYTIPFDVLQNGKVLSKENYNTNATTLQRLKEWFKNGGVVMYPLALSALLAVLLCLERFLTLTIRHHRYIKSYRKLMPLINAQDWNSASLFCKKSCSGLTRAIQEIVNFRHGSPEVAEQQVKQILLAEVPSLEKRLSIISTLAASAPLLGLLGTVSGMISLFEIITETGTNDARILAGGISEALITTQAGLLIAIPVLLIHGYLTERLDDILSHYNETVLEVFNIVFNGNKTVSKQ
jgi:biopolymer transport protein ExbB